MSRRAAVFRPAPFRLDPVEGGANTLRARSRRRTSHTTPRHVGISQFVCSFIDLAQFVRRCHWATHDYAVHKMTGDLYSKLDDFIDRFVEAFQGKDVAASSTRLNLAPGGRSKYNHGVASAPRLREGLDQFTDRLVALDQLLMPETDVDLLALRDEVVEAINQAKYLLTLV